jgi:peptide/nickel transport system permease protein
MLAYILNRLAQFLLVLAVGSVAIWAIIYAVPGTPAIALVGPDATPEELAAAEQRLGLDRPIHEQYLGWLQRTLRFDLGESAITGVSVGEQLVQRIPATIQLTLFTMVLSILIALPLGVISALRPGSLSSVLIGIYQAVTLAVPTVWVGILLVLAFSIGWKLLPRCRATFRSGRIPWGRSATRPCRR